LADTEQSFVNEEVLTAGRELVRRTTSGAFACEQLER